MALNSRAKKESLAAIVATFYDDHERQNEFYKRFSPELSGFPGIWNFLVDATDAFVFWESRVRNSNNGEWLDAIDHFADDLLTLKEIPCRRELREMSREALESSGYEF